MKVDISRYLDLRRDIHRHPELSNQEIETTERIRRFLKQDGLALQTFSNCIGGFVRLDQGKEKTLCMRADIDALPLTEKTGLPFASVNPGVMHACGHDMHTAIAAGVACELNRVRARLNCNLVVLFQPAEESSPIGGARPIVESGFLEAQRIDALYGLHNWPSLPVGEIGVKPGAIMAASDRFHIEIIGRTAHAAEPHLGVDAIMIASKIDCALVQDLRHEVDPFDPISVSIGAFSTEGRYNIVCEHAALDGTVRSTHEGTREYLHRRIREIAEGIARTYGGEAKVEITKGYGVVDNDPRLYEAFAECAKRVIGADNIHTDIHPSLIGEDMYYYGTRIPILYFHLGSESQHPLHSNQYLPKEACIETGIDLMTEFFLSQA